MIRCLITGGAGFIGSHLTEEAVSRGWEVVVLDNLSTGHAANLSRVADRISFIKGDVTEPAQVLSAARKCDLIFHHAALVSVPLSVEKPTLSAKINDFGTLNVFEAARLEGVRRVIVASSAAVYGMRHPPPHLETLPPDPVTPYAAHKLMGEYYARFYFSVYGIESICLRYFNVYGPRQDPSSPYSGVISIFADRILGGKPAKIFGDGLQQRDFVFVSDVVHANMCAAQCPRADGFAVNVATGQGITILQLWRSMSTIAGSRPNIEFSPARMGDIVASWADTSLARERLKFRSEISLENGLTKLFSYVNTHSPST